MVHLKNTSYSPREASELLHIAREVVEDEVIVRDTRVSRKYLEFDISVPDGITVENVLRELESISPVATYEQIVDRHLNDDEAVNRAIEQFNEEKYWGAHEALEQVWKRSSGKEKDLINGIILVAAAFVHDQKDEREVCLSILARAAAKLENSTGMYRGIDVDLIKSQIQNILQSGTIVRFSIG